MEHRVTRLEAFEKKAAGAVEAVDVAKLREALAGSEGTMLTALERNLIAAAISTKVDEAIASKYRTPTQEHQLTSRIAGLLEDLNGLEVLQQRVTVVAQEFSDKGRGSLEKPTGADLYISITDSGDNGFSKAILVQSKRLPTKRAAIIGSYYESLADPHLDEQCSKMIALSPDSYVWVYGDKGVGVVNAKTVLEVGEAALTPVVDRSAYDLFSKILECEEGDHRWGLPHDGDKRQRINDMMNRFREAVGIQFTQGVDIRISPAKEKRIGHRRHRS